MPFIHPCHGRLSLQLQPAMPAPTSSPIVVRECHQDARPGVHLVSPNYCNSLLFGISDGLLRRLQSVQNAAARLVTGARRCDHITPVLRQLCSRSRGSYISRLVDWLPRTSQTTVAYCRTLVVAHCGPTPMTFRSCLFHTNT